MRSPIVAVLFILASSHLHAQNAVPIPIQPQPESTPPTAQEKYEWREFATADVRNVVFNATTGFILFTVGGVTYRHTPQYNVGEISGANVSAVAATLSEL